jgi:hypothetical protein
MDNLLARWDMAETDKIDRLASNPVLQTQQKKAQRTARSKPAEHNQDQHDNNDQANPKSASRESGMDEHSAVDHRRR